MHLTVWNPTEENVSTRIHGNWFSFKPGQFKVMDIDKCNFIQMNRRETGLVVLPPEFCSSREEFVEGYAQSEEGKAILLQKREEGIQGLIDHHMGIVKNNQVSLRQDLAHRYPSADYEKLCKLEASKGELESMRLVAKYKGKASDSGAKKIEEIEKLMKQIGPITA